MQSAPRACGRAHQPRGSHAPSGGDREHPVHASTLDGAGCSNSSTPDVDFVVQHYASFCTAVGPFPSNAWADQQLKVPVCGLSRLLGVHELGHALGFRHEHPHSGASPRCTESGTSEDLRRCRGTDRLTGFQGSGAMGPAGGTRQRKEPPLIAAHGVVAVADAEVVDAIAGIGVALDTPVAVDIGVEPAGSRWRANLGDHQSALQPHGKLVKAATAGCQSIRAGASNTSVRSAGDRVMVCVPMKSSRSYQWSPSFSNMVSWANPSNMNSSLRVFV
jgi:hypothetical protein